jgi:hypothetical protein
LSAKTPVAIIPTIPPTPWHGKTSKVSSRVDLDFQWTARLLTIAAIAPIAIEAPTGT